LLHLQREVVWKRNCTIRRQRWARQEASDIWWSHKQLKRVRRRKRPHDVFFTEDRYSSTYRFLKSLLVSQSVYMMCTFFHVLLYLYSILLCRIFENNFFSFSFNRSWSLKDICLSPSPPGFENHWVDSVSFNFFFT